MQLTHERSNSYLQSSKSAINLLGTSTTSINIGSFLPQQANFQLTAGP